MILNQLWGAGGDWWSWIAWIVFMMIFFMFYPRLMLSQIMWKLEKTANMLEGMSTNSKKFLIKELNCGEAKKLNWNSGKLKIN